MKVRMNFLRKHKEFEPIFDAAAMNKNLVEEYKNKELQNQKSFQQRLVYDCFETSSPYYEKGQYIQNSQCTVVPPP